MSNPEVTSHTQAEGWHGKQVYGMAIVCLVFGLALGYLFRGSRSPGDPAQAKDGIKLVAPDNGVGAQMPSLEQMKHMAEKKAAPLLAKLKTDPNNAGLLIQVGDIYKQTHQFKDAADYYQRALNSDPGNAGVRSDLASVLYYNGEVDGALAQLQEALKRDPKNGAALFNLGMIKYQSKKDTSGAVAAWEQLLKLNPQLPAERKAAVEKMIAQAKRSAPQQ